MSINREYIKDWSITGTTSYYPPEQTDTYVKATTKYDTNYWPYYATDPAKTLTGDYFKNCWIALAGTKTNQRFHIDVGTACTINRIYYENTHSSGTGFDYGAKNFTLWGSNDADDFADLTYANDGTWTQITGLSQTYFDQHVAADTVDPKYIYISNNTTAYRYYAFKIADNWGASRMSIRRIVLQQYGRPMTAADGQVYMQYMQNKAKAGSLNHRVVAYTHGATGMTNNSYTSAILNLDGSRTYLIPYLMAPVTTGIWHYINNSTGAVVPYTHGVTGLTSNAYSAGVLRHDGRIYMIPYAQSTVATWHYIDTNGTIVPYTHGATVVGNAYFGGSIAPNGRIYMAPRNQATVAEWHYIDTDGTVVAYSHGSTAVNIAYYGAVTASNGKVYFCPFQQATEPIWHYVDTDGTVVAYTHGVTAVNQAYIGGVLVPNGRIYLIPYTQATAAVWHYIDTNTGAVVAYTHGATCVAFAYSNGVLGQDGRIYLIPYGQSTATEWHYIDTNTGAVVAYTHGATCVLAAYRGGVLTTNGKVWLSPFSQGTATVWHYIETYPTEDISTVVATSPFYNKF